MDLNDYWQENKRFVLLAIAGLIVFMIGEMFIGAFITSDLKAARSDRDNVRRSLGESRFLAKDLTAAQLENQALVAAKEQLAAAVAFQPRPEFVLDPARGSGFAKRQRGTSTWL